MFKSLKAVSDGWGFHIKGIRFGFQNFSFLILALIPFLVTLTLYVFAFYLFTLYADDLLSMIWHVDTAESSKYVGWIYWLYIRVVKALLYLVVLIIMFYTFIVLSNIVGSPIFDHISTKYERLFHDTEYPKKESSVSKGILTIIKEETKKAGLMLVVPLPLIFIPVVGQVLGFVAAAVFIAWDYVDFSLSRDCPLLKDRLRTLWRHKFLLVGFGGPLLIPLLGLVLVPFAILGSTRLYFDRIKETSSEHSSPA